jgi:UDP-glucose 4-epimerase
MRVAVTGGAGFIGRAVCDQLRAAHEVVVLDRPTSDVRIPETLTAIAECDVVIHLAGVLGTAELWDSPERAIDVNVKGTLNVLTQCLAGTAFVGITMPDCWANVYQATKIASQTLALGFHRDFQVPVTHIRAFNAYGKGQAHGPDHPQKIVPTFASRIYAGEPIPIWGDGQQTVDLVHVDHIAACLVDAAVSGSDDYGHGQIWDAGTGIETQVVKVAAAVQHCIGQPAVYDYLPMRAGETPNTRLCATTPPPRLGFGEHFDKLLGTVVESYSPILVG